MPESKASLAEVAGHQYFSHEQKKARHVHTRIISPKQIEPNPLKGFLEQELRKDLAPLLGSSEVVNNQHVAEKISSMAEKQFHSNMEHAERINGAEEKARDLMYDGLTKESRVFTRRAGDVALQTAINDAQRNQQGLGLLMIDHDHFKMVNDKYGHPAGDLVIQQMAAALRELTKRRNDFIVRYGGEEFSVVFPAITPEVLREKADLLEQIYDRRQQLLRGTEHPVFNERRTISRGITYLPPNDPRLIGKTNGEIVNLMYAEADDALLAAKELGRNQTQDYRNIDDRFKKTTRSQI